MTDELLVFFTCATQTGRWLHEHHHHGPITFVSICKWHSVRLTNFSLKVPPGGLDLSLGIRDRVPVVHVFQYTGAVEGAVHSISPKSLNSRLFFYFLFVESHRLQPPLARPGGGHSSFYLFQNRRPKINEIVVKIFIELFQNFFWGGAFNEIYDSAGACARALWCRSFRPTHTGLLTMDWWWMAVRQMRNKNRLPPLRYFIFFFRSKNLLCVPPLWPWSGRRLIPPKKNFPNSITFNWESQQQKIESGKKKKKKRKRQFLGQLRDLLPAVMTYNNNNNKSSQKGKSTGSELLDTKKRWNQWTLWFVPSKVARVCTSTCNDDLVAFFFLLPSPYFLHFLGAEKCVSNWRGSSAANDEWWPRSKNNMKMDPTIRPAPKGWSALHRETAPNEKRQWQTKDDGDQS